MSVTVTSSDGLPLLITHEPRAPRTFTSAGIGIGAHRYPSQRHPSAAKVRQRDVELMAIRIRLFDGAFLAAFDALGEGGIIEARRPMRRINGVLTRNY